MLKWSFDLKGCMLFIFLGKLISEKNLIIKKSGCQHIKVQMRIIEVVSHKTRIGLQKFYKDPTGFVVVTSYENYLLDIQRIWRSNYLLKDCRFMYQMHMHIRLLLWLLSILSIRIMSKKCHKKSYAGCQMVDINRIFCVCLQDNFNKRENAG